ncbi:MAG: hypothetical protein DRR16_31665 [Candidatus Parabeggiatoa sp. nov. 3]|nr:MAG: hypothetical protein DRR00_32930 [Gammaproteobacteria bacterium]RKZ75006.1 MAG: hypothetical protein DRR16_31665 [Gammaproteobacteria bacterium]
MALVKGYFDELHFTESTISDFKFLGNDLIIHIESGLAIYGEHPLSGNLTMSESCHVIFKNVIFSERDLDIYAGDPKTDGFKGTQKIIDDVNQPATDKNYQEYSIEGVLLQKPTAWVTWDIVAEEFYIDDLKE